MRGGNFCSGLLSEDEGLRVAKLWRGTHSEQGQGGPAVLGRNPPGGLVKRQIPTQQVWGGAQGSALPTGSQAVPLPPALGRTLGTEGLAGPDAEGRVPWGSAYWVTGIGREPTLALDTSWLLP